MTFRPAVALFLLLGCAESRAPSPARLPTTTTVPPLLRAPAELKPLLEATGRGVQIYTCSDGVWTLQGPEAELFDAGGKKIGRHFAGPTWQLDQGGMVVGVVKARVDAPAPDAVPWLLVDVKANDGSGVLAGAKNVQRLDTAGGKPPAGACQTPGEELRVPYSARYVFLGL